MTNYEKIKNISVEALEKIIDYGKNSNDLMKEGRVEDANRKSLIDSGIYGHIPAPNIKEAINIAKAALDKVKGGHSNNTTT